MHLITQLTSVFTRTVPIFALFFIVTLLTIHACACVYYGEDSTDCDEGDIVIGCDDGDGAFGLDQSNTRVSASLTSQPCHHNRLQALVTAWADKEAALKAVLKQKHRPLKVAARELQEVRLWAMGRVRV